MKGNGLNRLSQGEGAPDLPARTPIQTSTRGGVKFQSSILTLSFLIVFPCFFFYHTAVAKGLIPPILGGYSTNIAVLVLPVMIVFYLNAARWSGDRLSSWDMFFFGFIGYFFCISLGHYFLGYNPSIVEPHLAIIPQFIALFIIARNVDPSNREFRIMITLSFIAMSLIVFSNASEGIFVVVAHYVRDAPEKAADYQGYAYVFVVVTLFFVSHLRFAWVRILAYIMALVTLFLNGARSEFVGFIFACLIIEFCFSKRRILIFGIFAGLILSGLSILKIMLDYFPDNRVLGLLSIGTDDSVSDRAGMMKNAINTLFQHPFSGDYGSYSPGAWAHNILSVWVDLGLVGFLAFSALLLIPMVDLARSFKSRSREPGYILTLSVMCYSILLFAAAKYFTYQIFPVAVALYVRFRLKPANSSIAC